MKYLWTILSTIFTIVIFYIFYKMIHSKNASSPNNKTEKWGYWKSTKIFVCLFILFSAFFYSLQNFSWVQRWLVPSTAVLSMQGGGGSMMEDYIQSGGGSGGGGGGGGDSRTIEVEYRDARDVQEVRERRRSDAQERHVVVNNVSREENYNRSRERSHRERDNYDYNDNILTDPPNF